MRSKIGCDDSGTRPCFDRRYCSANGRKNEWMKEDQRMKGEDQRMKGQDTRMMLEEFGYSFHCSSC